MPSSIEDYKISNIHYKIWMLTEKKIAAILHGGDTTACFCSTALSPQGSCLISSTYCLPFPKNPLGVILGLGLF